MNESNETTNTSISLNIIDSLSVLNINSNVVNEIYIENENIINVYNENICR